MGYFIAGFKGWQKDNHIEYFSVGRSIIALSEWNLRITVDSTIGDDGHLVEKPRAGLKCPWALITEAAGLQGHRINGIRHSFASAGAGGGNGLAIIGKLLRHTQAATTARYAHLVISITKGIRGDSTTVSAAMKMTALSTIFIRRLVRHALDFHVATTVMSILFSRTRCASDTLFPQDDWRFGTTPFETANGPCADRPA